MRVSGAKSRRKVVAASSRIVAASEIYSRIFLSAAGLPYFDRPVSEQKFKVAAGA
jgi:hypothetical protein